jgi:antitoxin component YwqK of YwqJK toxin-antitoxin module
MRTLQQLRNFSFILFFMVMPLTAQENGLSKTYVQEGDQIRYTEYFKNGQIAQTGYFLNGKNHGLWTSYNQDGSKKSEGTFENGKKVDAWFFWDKTILIEVTFKDNMIEHAIQWDKSEILASKLQED